MERTKSNKRLFLYQMGPNPSAGGDGRPRVSVGFEIEITGLLGTGTYLFYPEKSSKKEQGTREEAYSRKE
jgi:hypothetical protein